MNDTTPKWLQKIQDNSWEPEIIISGLTITFVFIINDSIYNFFAMLIQDAGAELTALILYGFFISCLNVVKLVFIVHLLFRGLWVALVGLSYVYPEGVNPEKLPKGHKGVVFSKPSDMVLKVEKICSLLFSVMFVFIFFLFIMTLMYTPFILFEMLLIDNYIIYYLVIMALLFLLSIAAIIFNKSKLVKKMNNNWINNVFYTISTNTGNKSSLLILAVLFVFSLVMSFPQVKSFLFINPFSFVDKNSVEVINPEKYLIERDKRLRISKSAIQSYEIGNDIIRLFIGDYKTDKVTIDKLKENYREFDKQDFPLDTANMTVTDLVQVTIDSVVIKDYKWYQSIVQPTRQKGKICNLPVSGLEQGSHTLRIKKLVWNRIKNEFNVVENWDAIPFLILE